MSEVDATVRQELETRATEELVSILRNRDEQQWRPEVFDIVASILAARGLSPAEIVSMGPEGVDVVEGQQLVTLARYFNTVEAHTHRMALEEAGLLAWVSDESGGAMFGVGVGSRLQVRVEDEAAARAVLEAAAVPASALPQEFAEPPCPGCGSREVRKAAALAEPPASLEADGPRRAGRYECAACGHSWSE